MAQHKAPTAVTFATSDDKNAFQRFVEVAWKPAAVIILGIASYAIYRSFTSMQEVKNLDKSWSQLAAAASAKPANPLTIEADPAALMTAHEKLKGLPAAPWALWAAATNAAERSEWDAALTALEALKKEHANHPLVTDQIAVRDGGAAVSLVSELERRCREQKAWRESRANLFDNPAPAEGSPRVRIKTDLGDIVVALYANEAPKHVENFLKLSREGYFHGTRFHRVVKDFMIQGGDPNSRGEDKATWGQGGPDYKIDKEENNLHHFPGYLSAAKKPSDEQSSGSQFFITTADSTRLDGQHVVYGKVIEGMDIVRQIEGGEIESGSSDRPAKPVVLLSTEVL
jgi:peptidyl-prolyl cis-trans isomerase B (cyclophilin B)